VCSIAFILSIFTELKITQYIAVDNSCIEFYPSWMKNVKNMRTFFFKSYTEYALHCTDFHKNNGIKMTLRGELLYWISPRSVMKYGKCRKIQWHLYVKYDCDYANCHKNHTCSITFHKETYTEFHENPKFSCWWIRRHGLHTGIFFLPCKGCLNAICVSTSSYNKLHGAESSMGW
jgi:hypothetical protein